MFFGEHLHWGMGTTGNKVKQTNCGAMKGFFKKYFPFFVQSEL